MEHRTTVLIADDQRLFADNLRSVLEFRCNDFFVVGVVKDGRAAVEFVRQSPPDIVLMDVRMPILDGVRATETIHREFPEVKILVLTTFDDDDSVYEAVRCGAKGYLLKNIPFDDLVAALRAIRSGTALFSPDVIAKLFRTPAPPGGEPFSEAGVPTWFRDLGRREKDILKLMGQGLDNPAIARELFISEQTVKNYVYGLYGKIGEHNRVKVVQILQRYASLFEGDAGPSPSLPPSGRKD